MKFPHFSAKILLFGEYAIVLGGTGLAGPLAAYSGSFCYAQPTVRHAPHIAQSQESLLSLAAHWQGRHLSFDFNAQELLNDVRHGLFFSSDIPQGYGVGSSGALVAAIYDRYVGKSDSKAGTPLSLGALKAELAILESFFHGQSSGVDPLISYLNRPLLLLSASEVQPVVLPQYNESSKNALHEGARSGGIVLFLYDTKMVRKTAPLVAWFMQHCKDDKSFETLCSQQLTDLNNACISAFLEQKSDILLSKWAQLSAFQLQYLRPLIPDNMREIWQNGLHTEKYFLKLCGAGGGGFMLGICTDWGATIAQLGQENVQLLTL